MCMYFTDYNLCCPYIHGRDYQLVCDGHIKATLLKQTYFLHNPSAKETPSADCRSISLLLSLPNPTPLVSVAQNLLWSSLLSLTSSIRIKRFFSPNLPSPNSSHNPSLQHQQVFTGNIPDSQARETGKPIEDLYNSLLPLQI